jgi:hypothetical protein
MPGEHHIEGTGTADAIPVLGGRCDERPESHQGRIAYRHEE